MALLLFEDLAEGVIKPVVLGAVLADLIISGVLGIIDRKYVSKRNKVSGALS